ncbi:MAG: hypothetical protein HYS13_19980 [Planctomycetia bacterium]|nr:hypothetical protein [Planctomycetia bacterium]
MRLVVRPTRWLSIAALAAYLLAQAGAAVLHDHGARGGGCSHVHASLCGLSHSHSHDHSQDAHRHCRHSTAEHEAGQPSTSGPALAPSACGDECFICTYLAQRCVSASVSCDLAVRSALPLVDSQPASAELLLPRWLTRSRAPPAV